jgi:phosphate transport system substrate-binding protein
MKTRMGRVVAISSVVALLLTACGGDSGGADGTGAPQSTKAPQSTEASTGSGGSSMWGLPTIDPLDATPGDIGIAGSSTVFPLSTAILTKWEDEGGPGYAIDSIGSGGGFERFCVEGASDISNASRAIKDDEVASCADIGRSIIEIRVGSDALSVVVSRGNTFATELTLEELATVFSLPAGSTWDQVNPDFPAHPLQVFSPGADSGTFDYFNEIVYDEADPSPILSGGAEIVGEDDNITVQGVGQDGCTEGDLSTTCAVGYFGFAFFQQNADVLQAAAINAGDGFVIPGAETVDTGMYPISRPLFMYTATEVVAEKPQVAEFIAYYLENVNEVISDVGYFPAPDADLQEAADNIKAAAGW